jgi:hypothetical protein
VSTIDSVMEDATEGICFSPFYSPLYQSFILMRLLLGKRGEITIVISFFFLSTRLGLSREG